MSAAASALSLGRELAAICGEAYVSEDPAALQALEIEGVVPAVAVEPASAEEVAAILRMATARDLVVVPSGGFTQQAGGGVPARVDILLRTARMRSIRYYDPGDLTFGAEAGITIHEIDQRLAEKAQWLPLDVVRPESATLGGVLATAAHGPLKHAFGGVREFCIGVSFVTGDGTLAKGGGRVVKNVAGYDLMKLLIGSQGTLGVLVEANFKVFPRPRQTRTFVVEFAELDEAMRFRDRVLRSPLRPLCLELISPRASEYLTETPPVVRDVDEVEPAHPSGTALGAWQVLVRAAGSDAALARYHRALGAEVARELAGMDEAQAWRCVTGFAANVLARHQNAMLLDLNLPIASVRDALAAAERAGLENNFLCAVVGRAGIGSLVVAFIPLLVDPPSAMLYANAVSNLRGSLPRDASAVVTRCPREAKLHFSLWGSPPTDIECMRAVKRALDPGNVLNRGRFVV
ncbi:MAG: FAD-binding oxidoreductase [Terriglobales bacterium]